VVLAKTPMLTTDDLPSSMAGPRPTEATSGSLIPGASMLDIEREAILRTMEMVQGSTAKTAEVLGISIRKIQYRLKEYGAGTPPKPEAELD
jgi:DNA-binding NtrC family response regulator